MTFLTTRSGLYIFDPKLGYTNSAECTVLINSSNMMLAIALNLTVT